MIASRLMFKLDYWRSLCRRGDAPIRTDVTSLAFVLCRCFLDRFHYHVSCFCISLCLGLGSYTSGNRFCVWLQAIFFFLILLSNQGSRDSTVDISTGYGLDEGGVGVRFLVGVTFFLLVFTSISYMHFRSPHLCYMPCPSHPPWLDHSTWRRLRVMKLLIMQFSPTSRHFISLRFKYSFQHHVLKRLQTKVRGPLWHFVRRLFFTVRSWEPHAQTPS
jgi:hypothetical protein